MRIKYVCSTHTRSFGEWAGDVLGGNEHITYPHRDCQWKIEEQKYRRHTLYSTPYDRTQCAQCTRCCSMQSAYNRQPMLGCQWYSQNSIKFNHISSLFIANITILLQRIICGNNNKIDRGGALRIVAMCGSEQHADAHWNTERGTIFAFYVNIIFREMHAHARARTLYKWVISIGIDWRSHLHHSTLCIGKISIIRSAHGNYYYRYYVFIHVIKTQMLTNSHMQAHQFRWTHNGMRK